MPNRDTVMLRISKKALKALQERAKKENRSMRAVIDVWLKV